MTVYAHRHDCKNDAPEEMCLGCISAKYEELEAEIERLRENCFGYPALLDDLPDETLMALHDHIHTIIDERNGNDISQARKAKAKKARSALQQNEAQILATNKYEAEGRN